MRRLGDQMARVGPFGRTIVRPSTRSIPSASGRALDVGATMKVMTDKGWKRLHIAAATLFFAFQPRTRWTGTGSASCGRSRSEGAGDDGDLAADLGVVVVS